MHPDIGPATASTQDDDALRQPLELPMLFHRPLVLALSLACAGPLPLLPASAHAQAASRHFDLPAQPLASALDAYSRLTGVDLVIGAALPGGQTAPAK